VLDEIRDRIRREQLAELEVAIATPRHNGGARR
jgi:hypothetical protein